MIIRPLYLVLLMATGALAAQAPSDYDEIPQPTMSVAEVNARPTVPPAPATSRTDRTAYARPKPELEPASQTLERVWIPSQRIPRNIRCQPRTLRWCCRR